MVQSYVLFLGGGGRDSDIIVPPGGSQLLSVASCAPPYTYDMYR